MLEQKLYTVADVAELTGLTSRTIRNYLKDGTLQGRKIGVQWRFTEEDINRLFSEVDIGGQKVVHIEDVASAFLQEGSQTEAEGCLMVTIPYTDQKELEACQEKWQKICQDQTEGFVMMTEVIEDKGIFRIAMRGGIRKIEEMTARMRRFEQLRQ